MPPCICLYLKSDTKDKNSQHKSMFKPDACFKVIWEALDRHLKKQEVKLQLLTLTLTKCPGLFGHAACAAAQVFFLRWKLGYLRRNSLEGGTEELKSGTGEVAAPHLDLFEAREKYVLVSGAPLW